MHFQPPSLIISILQRTRSLFANSLRPRMALRQAHLIHSRLSYLRELPVSPYPNGRKEGIR